MPPTPEIAIEVLESKGYRAYRKLWSNDLSALEFYREYVAAQAAVDTAHETVPLRLEWRRAHVPSGARRWTLFDVLVALVLPFWMTFGSRGEWGAYWTFTSEHPIPPTSVRSLKWRRFRAGCGLIGLVIVTSLAGITAFFGIVIGLAIRGTDPDWKNYLLFGSIAALVCWGAHRGMRRCELAGLPPLAKSIRRHGFQLRKVRFPKQPS